MTPFPSTMLLPRPPHGTAPLPAAAAALPARRAGGIRARGHFTCDAALQALTAAPWFAESGRRRAVTLSIRRCGEPAQADTVRGAFAFDVAFHDAQETRPAGGDTLRGGAVR